MSKPFEVWAEQEIVRLRTEADALERALRKYLESEASPLQRTAAAVRQEPQRRPLGRRPGSKAQAFRDFIVEASVRGVTLHDMYQFADANQLGMAKNNVRGRLWGMKKRGEIVERNGRYYYVGIGPEAKAPDPTIPAPVGAAE